MKDPATKPTNRRIDDKILIASNDLRYPEDGWGGEGDADAVGCRGIAGTGTVNFPPRRRFANPAITLCSVPVSSLLVSS